MTDPYTLLGIQRNASDDEIKKAYRSLSRQYHPDANINNPNKKQAEARFKEVQQAYQQIMKEREYGSAGSSGNYNDSGDAGSYWDFGSFGNWGSFGGFYGQTGQSGQSASESEGDIYLRAAANYINSRHYKEALNVLSGITERSPNWYYYSAIANSGAGNNVIALDHAKTAYQMEPGNMQYQVLLQRLQSGGNWYQTQQNPYQTTSMGSDHCCMKLCIANIVCNLCCGGGTICCGPSGGYI